MGKRKPRGKVGKGRRTLKNIDRWMNLPEIYILITARTWGYKTNIPFYVIRDRALMSLYLLTGGRRSEVLRLRKGDFREIPEGLIIENMVVKKRKKATIEKYGAKVQIRDIIFLPSNEENILSDFVKLVREYLLIVRNQDEFLFPFSGVRAWQIVRKVTGKWVHWFRAMSENFYGKYVFKDATQLAKFLKIQNPYQVSSYIPFDEELYLRRVKQLREA